MLRLSLIEIDGDGELWFGDNVPKNLWIGFSLQASFAGWLGFVEDIDELLFDPSAGVTNGVNNASPVRIVAVPGALDQLRIGNSLRDLLGVRFGSGVDDLERDELGNAFAIADDGFGELVHNKAESVFENLTLFASASNCFVAGGTVGEDQDGVVGAGVAIDGDAIEGMLEGAFEGSFQTGFGDVGISGDVTKHGRHIGIDHARSFGTSADADALLPNLKRDCEFLLVSIARDDGAGDVVSIFGSEISKQLFVVRIDSVHREGEANDPSGTHCNLPLFNLEKLGDAFGHRFCIGDANRTRAGIGIATVGDDGAGMDCFEVVLSDLKRSGLHLILREGSPGNARKLGIDQPQIEAIGFGVFDPTGHGTSEEAARGTYAAFDSSIGLIHLGRRRLAAA